MASCQLALLVWVAVSTAVLGRKAAVTDCIFRLPATDKPASCVKFNLTQIAAQGAVNVTQSSPWYVVSLCQNVTTSALPRVCAGKEPSPAYQYTADSCHVAGNLNSSLVYPVDPTNSSAGIRIAYNNGEGTFEGYWPRATIIDFHCDPKAGVGEPQYVYEYPTFTYKVHWPSSLACPVATSNTSCQLTNFSSTWDSLRFRSRPSWYDDAKFGIFIHWGVFSVPSYLSEWYWKRLILGEAPFVEFHNRVFGCSGIEPSKFPCTGRNFSYPEFAAMFKAELWDPDSWADLFRESGAKYVVFTSKHHEGWCNFRESHHWNWNSIDEGPKRDLVRDLTSSVRKTGLRMGLYHSLREWFNPLYVKDQANNCSTTSFVDTVLVPTLKEMVTQYTPDVVWADGAGDAPCTHNSVHYWKSPHFLSWLYNESPVKTSTVVNNRWGKPGFGDFTTGCDRSPSLYQYKWEKCLSIQKTSFGYDRSEGIADMWNTTYLLWQLVSSVSCNANFLLNIGPTHDGRIVPAFQERLLQIGAWLSTNGEAIYGSVPWKCQNDTGKGLTWYTASKDGSTVYAITFGELIPRSEFVLKHALATVATKVWLLGYQDEPLNYANEADGLHLKIPPVPYGKLQFAWTFKLLSVKYKQIQSF